MREDEQTAHIADDGGAAITLSYVLGVLRRFALLIAALLPALEGGPAPLGLDASTENWLARLRNS